MALNGPTFSYVLQEQFLEKTGWFPQIIKSWIAEPMISPAFLLQQMICLMFKAMAQETKPWNVMREKQSYLYHQLLGVHMYMCDIK